MQDEGRAKPDTTAVRVSLWRAMHVQIDPPPHVLEDEVGIRLVAPDDGWRRRPDMDPDAMRPFRASIVARARFIADSGQVLIPRAFLIGRGILLQPGVRLGGANSFR